MSEATHLPGHNSGVIDINILLDPENLRDQWELSHQIRFVKRDTLLEAADTWVATFKDKPLTEDDARNVQDFVTQLRDETKLFNQLHEKEKAPYRAAGLAADALFLHESKKVLEEKILSFTGGGERGEPLGLLTRYQRDKIEKERLAREEELKTAREAAQRALDAAEKTLSPDLVDNAQQAEQKAQVAEAAVMAPVSDLSRLRGTRGSVGGLREAWYWKVTDLKALLQAAIDGTVPLEYVVPNEQMINALVRPKNGVRSIPGLEIYSSTKSQVR